MLRVMLVNATMLQGFTTTPDVLGLYWTLKIELIFYVLCATLHWLGALHNPRLIILAAWALLLTSKGAFGPHLT
jgi:peptidoglycan/LPS O-acetylase OafA/YrhL